MPDWYTEYDRECTCARVRAWETAMERAAMDRAFAQTYRGRRLQLQAAYADMEREIIVSIGPVVWPILEGISRVVAAVTDTYAKFLHRGA